MYLTPLGDIALEFWRLSAKDQRKVDEIIDAFRVQVKELHLPDLSGVPVCVYGGWGNGYVEVGTDLDSFLTSFKEECRPRDATETTTSDLVWGFYAILATTERSTHQ